MAQQTYFELWLPVANADVHEQNMHMGTSTDSVSGCSVWVQKTWCNNMFSLGPLWRPATGNPETITQQTFLRQRGKWRLLPSNNALHDPLPHTHTHTHTRHTAPSLISTSVWLYHPPSWPNVLWGRAEWWALWWHVYGGSEQRGTLPGVVAQVIHYDVTSEEEMKWSQAPCVSCLCRLLKKKTQGG